MKTISEEKAEELALEQARENYFERKYKSDNIDESEAQIGGTYWEKGI